MVTQNIDARYVLWLTYSEYVFILSLLCVAIINIHYHLAQIGG